MRERPQKKKSNFYHTLCTVLTTLLFVAIVWVISLAWQTLGNHTNEVSYSAGEAEIVGSVPATRKFNPGDEVVVRTAELTQAGKKLVGWRDTEGVIDYIDDVLAIGTVFIMPESDVVLEAVWEEDEEAVAVSSDSTSDTLDIYYKKAGKDYINIRENHGYDSDIIAKISDSDTKIEYTGKYEKVYDEDEEKSYDWYFVKIPSKDIEGWIRSDLLTKEGGKSAASTDEDIEEGEKYLKSHKYDVALMHIKADSSSEVVEKVEDDETILYFNNKSEEVVDSDGDKTTWYFVKDSATGKSGWIDSKRLEHVTD